MRKLDGGNFDAANRAAIKLVSRHWSEIRNGAGAPKRAVSSSFALHGRAMNGRKGASHPAIAPRRSRSATRAGAFAT